MTAFDYIILGFALFHLAITSIAISRIPECLYHKVTFSSMCHIWWIAPLIVIYRVWG